MRASLGVGHFRYNPRLYPRLYRYVGNAPTMERDTNGLGPGDIGDLLFPSYVKFGPGFSPNGGPWSNQNPLGNGPTYDPLPTNGKYNPTDGIWTPGGYLKIPFATIVYVTGSTPDGRPILYCNGPVTWYPAGTQTPFYNDNPSSPQKEGPTSTPAPVTIGPNWPWQGPSGSKWQPGPVNKYP